MSLIARCAWLTLAAVALLAVCLPPLASAARSVFAAHMLQHLLVIAVAAPLLALSVTGWRWPSAATAWLLFVGTFLFWHWPVAFRWADHSELTRLLELASILLTATVFWMAAFHALNSGAAALYVVAAAVATDFPGVIMIFAPTAVCTMPGERATVWYLTPLADQQLAGLLMWVPANLVFFSIAIALTARWFAPSPKLVTL
jgi:putative membrane protein